MNSYTVRTLFIGLILLLLGLYQLSYLTITKAQLMPIKGTFFAGNNILSKHITQNKSGPKTKYNRIDLVFYISNSRYQFNIFENVDHKTYSHKLDQILMKLKQARSLIIWIKPSDAYKICPEVFCIENDKNEVILDLNTIKKEHQTAAMFALIIGFFILSLSAINFLASHQSNLPIKLRWLITKLHSILIKK
jgi:hypothetical protein